MTVAGIDRTVSTGALDDADRLGAQLIRFMRAINRAKTQLAKHGPDGLEKLAYAVLFCLVHDGPQRTGKLAEQLHAEISTISRQSRTLVEHGLVERRADPIDGRACVLAATAEGERVFEENRRLRNLWMAEMLADWPDTDRSTLIALLDRLNSSIESTPPRQVEPS
ncbi:MarR family transcriptional regulator [Nocardia terpenica]|uniref:MarR family transcriptional regulator n=1 Tax=Nocardia terpenica TaxID=455432 RepID=A0A164P9I6_9NOCA|nr:MarR family transcriptional regulator [Nocardia terpenica]KZM75286.1 MarR family transcriptional regulator [Nocardia terpenica]MBF6063643.1 MarR family transcriptional regulator [Nocardia terpenica]MBF6107019.1 MarR family transcriptional regulator [Nocardia terpenica]MBF6114192.1 MarR family transcriptional regulator [Nocardia terpenica]MBF6121721.1 MarR family transcriptional regulator [Nocardia terpenica]